MRGLPVFTTLFLLACTRATPPSSTQPSDVSSTADAGKFELAACGARVSLPGAPKCSDDVTKAPIGPIEAHACRLTTSTKPLVVYVAACEDYPDEYVRKVHNPSGMLAASLQGEVESSHGKLLESKDVTLGTIAGKEATIDLGNAVMRARVFIAGRRVFHFAVVGPSDVAQKDAAELFDSIELTVKTP